MHEAIKQTTPKRPKSVSLQDRAAFHGGTGATKGKIPDLGIPLPNWQEGWIEGRACQGKEVIFQKT